jgi:SPOR domain
MRTVFLLLVLINVGFFAYAHVAREGGSTSQISRLEVSPEKIKLMSGRIGSEKPRPENGAGPGKSASPAACLEWGIFAGPEIARADIALARLEVPQERIERVVADAGGYWVYIPPLKSKAETDRKVGELKALGITDFFLVQESAQWRNAISLGIFRTDEAAQVFLNKLKERGVRSAIAERRENFLKQIVFMVREPDPAMVARLAALQKEFAGSELKATQCPAASAAKS